MTKLVKLKYKDLKKGMRFVNKRNESFTITRKGKDTFGYITHVKHKDLYPAEDWDKFEYKVWFLDVTWKVKNDIKDWLNE